MTTHNYHWKHLPSGKSGMHTITDEEIFQQFSHLLIGSRIPTIYFVINHWNKTSDEWKYWI